MRRTTEPETKSLPFEGIGFDEVDGVIEGLAAVTGNVDLVGDRIMPGAFTKTINDHRVNWLKLPMGLDHEVGFGVTLGMEEVGRDALPVRVKSEEPDATGGLFCRGQVVMTDDNIARLGRMRNHMAAGAPLRMSITYRPIRQAKSQERGRTVRELRELAVHEWGPALRKQAVNTAAYVTAVKATETPMGNNQKAAIAGSYEELRDTLWRMIKDQGALPGTDGYIEATLPDHVIVTMYSNEDEPGGTYRVDYMMADGGLVLGNATPVDLEMTVVPRMVNLGAELDLTAMVNEIAGEMKAGRVLRRELLVALDEALDKLSRIRAAANRPDADEEPAGEKAMTVNDAAVSWAKGKIKGGDVDTESAWSFSADDGDAILGDPPDWGAYAKHHLAIDSDANEETRGRYRYPFAKDGKVYRTGLTAVRQRAGQQGADAIFEAAGTLLEMIDAKEPQEGKAAMLLLGADLALLETRAALAAVGR